MKILKLAFTSKALFDLTGPCLLYRQAHDEHGPDEAAKVFDDEMLSQIDTPLPPGPMLPIVKALQKTGLVEFGLFSKMSALSGKRVLRSLEAHGIQLKESYFTGGAPAYPKANDYHLYFGGDEKEVKAALEQGQPAVYLLPSQSLDENITELRIAFDFDNFIASDESDQQTAIDLEHFFAHERSNLYRPLTPSKFTPAVKAFSDLRLHLQGKSDGLQLVLGLVTSRGGPGVTNPKHNNSARVFLTLEKEQIEFTPGHMYFMNGQSKGPQVKAFGAHIFFDDSRKHCDNVVEHCEAIISAHAPHGVTNLNFVPSTRSPLHYMKPKALGNTQEQEAVVGQSSKMNLAS